MKAKNIKWDTDGDKKLFKELPAEIEIPKGMIDADEISDYLSDTTGFCHDGFVLEIMTEDYEELKNAVWMNGVEAIDDLLGYEHDVNEDADTTENRMDEVLDQMPEDEFLMFYNKYFKECQTKRLHISMAYTYVGDTGIDVPMELLKGKSKEEQLQIAYDYAREHISEIPVACNAEYVPDSDQFEMEDVEFEED